ncbi:unnamed protein product [Mytilus edulis]|uniref:C17orf113 probable zinc finger domain-containing protein n=1 Tax=Mytilus edulis TaxID=6550 RepID=A0A8S3S9R2_MYTED|nr:unnamed protein product [Mytilus edulis]
MSKRVRHASEPSSVQSTIGAFFESGENSKKRKRNDDSDDESVKSASPVKSKKHRSTFYKAWESKYQWLTYEEEEGMFCTLCIKFKQQAKNTEVWTKVGCKSYREDVIRNHERTSYHQVSVNMERDSLISKTTGGIGQALDTVVTLERRAFIAALRCMYFLLKKEIPHTSNFGDLLDLVKENGCSYLDTLNVEGRVKYQSQRAIQEMVWCLDCERGFSVLNRVKTRARNRLSQKVLNNLMMVSTQGPEGKDFNFNRAAELWASLSQRKLDIGIINDDV